RCRRPRRGPRPPARSRRPARGREGADESAAAWSMAWGRLLNVRRGQTAAGQWVGRVARRDEDDVTARGMSERGGFGPGHHGLRVLGLTNERATKSLAQPRPAE